MIGVETYYPWQKEIIEYEGDVSIRGGRQTGKSEGVAEQIIARMRKYPGSRSLIISPSERQETYLWEKVKMRTQKKDWKKRVTLHYGLMKNGSEMFKFPVGKTGIYLEGLSSVDFLYVDEAIGMSEKAWDAILPMLAEPKSRGKGWITLLSNTRGKSQFFKNSFKEGSGFKTYHISAEECPHISKEFLEKEKQRLGELFYTMLYLGEFVDFEFNYFNKEELDGMFCLQSWTLNKNYDKGKKYFLGIDPAGKGRSEASFVIGEEEGERMNIIFDDGITKSNLPQLMEKTIDLHGKFKFNEILIDSNGIGKGLYDFLRDKFGRIIIDLNNAARGESGRILKEDLYSNVKRLIAQGRLRSVRSEKLRESMESIEWDGERFSGKRSDRCEALIRACWGIKEKRFRPKFV